MLGASYMTVKIICRNYMQISILFLRLYLRLMFDNIPMICQMVEFDKMAELFKMSD